MNKTNFSLALGALQKQAFLQAEIRVLDTSTPEGDARRDAIQREMTASYHVSDRYVRECGRIQALLADDLMLNIADLTPEQLVQSIGG